MSKEQVNYIDAIDEKIQLYQSGMTEVNKLVSNGQDLKAAEKGLKIILQSCGYISDTSDLHELLRHCRLVMGEITSFINESMPLHDMVNRIKGILIERHAFYRQLKNSSNWVSL